jgi:hypothetical protein
VESANRIKKDDLDIQLLLTVQQACNSTGVKIPWDRVAATMGPKFSEGAIIQHLSKLRIRRENEGKNNPPSLRRSVGGGSTAMTPVSGSVGTPKRGKKKRKAATRKHDDTPPQNEIEGEDDEYDSDEDEDPSYSTKSKRGSVKRTNPKGKNNKRRKAATSEVESEKDNENNLVCAGAPFLALKGDTESGSESDGSRDESAEGDSVEDMAQEKRQSKMVSLGINPAALQNLQDFGSASTGVSTNTLNQQAPHWDQGLFTEHNTYYGHPNSHLGQYGGLTYGYPSPQPLATFPGSPVFMPQGYDPSIDPRAIMTSGPGGPYAQQGVFVPGFNAFSNFHQQSPQVIASQPVESNEMPDQNVLDYMWTRSETGEGESLD